MTFPAPTNSNKHVAFERERGVYDVTVTPRVAHVSVTVDPDDRRAEQVKRLFRLIADAQVPIFVVKLHSAAVSFGVEGSDVERVEEALQSEKLTFRVRRDLAIITVLASSMRDLTGIMVRIADALQLAQARMYEAGDSHSSVQCLIDGHRADAAQEQLRHAFGLGAACG